VRVGRCQANDEEAFSRNGGRLFFIKGGKKLGLSILILTAVIRMKNGEN
jgi:hypothetical protein